MEVSLYPTFLPSNACCNRPGSLVNCCGSLPGRKDLLRRISVWTGVKEKVWAGGFKMMSTPSVWTGNKSGMQKLPFKSDGYNFWTWRGYKIHYVVQGEGLPVLLIHGFGASVFHWRYNVPELAKNFRVFAMDLLGFGLTEKALIDYSANVWRDQVADFVKEVIKDRAILVGNSVGGFTVLFTAASYPDLVSGVALLNASGKFDNPVDMERVQQVKEETVFQRFILGPLKDWVQRQTIMLTFWQAKQPARIQSVLNNVYVDKTNVDNYLVNSIVQPTLDANAGEVYYRLMRQIIFQPSDLTLNKLLAKLSCPLLLVWGDLDPWMGSEKADKINHLYPGASVVRLQAGHCPHDEVPDLVNDALSSWISSLQSVSATVA
eukprot:c25768_g1_i3 orf=102-1229(+)